MSSRSFPILFLAVAAGLASQNLFAAAGALEISAACAVTGCFTGDTAGLPVTITKSGSYVLTSNLAATGSDAIRINVSGVQLDLRGFHISGPVACTGSPAVCIPTLATSSGEGVSAASNVQGVVVRNGSVAGFTTGVRSSVRGLVEDVDSSGNSNQGVTIRDGAVARRVTASSNGRLGIEVGVGGQVVDSSANDNGQFGISMDHATLRNSSAYRNASWGIYDWGRSLIEGCVVNDNNDIGIEVTNGGSSLVNNVITGNSSFGLKLSGGTAIETPSPPTLMAGNTLNGNNGGSAMSQISGASRFHSTPSLCGAGACP